MNPLTRILYYVLQWTFGILQNLAGGVIFLALRLRKGAPKPFLFHGAVVSEWRKNASMAMGMFIFLGEKEEPRRRRVLVHELGHTVQSVILGPLYLPVIGLPSVVWANAGAMKKRRLKKRIGYTDFYPERWASRAGERVTKEKAYWDHGREDRV